MSVVAVELWSVVVWTLFDFASLESVILLPATARVVYVVAALPTVEVWTLVVVELLGIVAVNLTLKRHLLLAPLT
jgi:hypothetical protein